MLKVTKIKSYIKLMRIDKPIGILLLLWPTLIALWIAGNGQPDWIVVGIFIVGTVLMRSAGCVMNDLADSRFDGAVTRTKFRPLVTDEVSKKEALVLASLLTIIAFLLILALNLLTIKLSIIALILAVTYPLMKRCISIPQAYLGIAFGFGIPMAFAAIQNQVPILAWWLVMANIFWAIAYDTEYAMVDREDDLKINIKSSAITFGHYDVLAVMVCYAITISIFTVVGIYLSVKSPYFLGLLAASSVAIYHYHLIKNRQKEDCFKAFQHNTWFGMAIFIGLLLSYLA
jgi:4-hydroxybenzoate polyprenyltransferase